MNLRGGAVCCVIVWLGCLGSPVEGQTAPQPQSRSTMLVTDAKNIVTEITEYAIQEGASKEPGKIFSAERGNWEVTFDLDQIAQIAVTRKKGETSRCSLVIKLLRGEVTGAEKMAYSGSTWLKGRTKSGDPYSTLLCDAKIVSFK